MQKEYEIYRFRMLQYHLIFQLAISFILIISRGNKVKLCGYLNDFCISEPRKLRRLNSKLLVILGNKVFDSDEIALLRLQSKVSKY